MNHSIMMGRLVRDPQMNYIENDNGEEVPVANFRLAVDRKFSDETDYFPCSAFGRLAEFADQYLCQGIKVLVNGRMENNNYTNKDGDKVYGVCLRLNDIEFAESKNAQRADDNDNGKGKGSGSRRSSSGSRGSSGNSRAGRSSSGRSSRNSQSSSNRGGYRNNNSGNGRSSRDRQVDEDFDNMNDDYNFN